MLPRMRSISPLLLPIQFLAGGGVGEFRFAVCSLSAVTTRERGKAIGQHQGHFYLYAGLVIYLNCTCYVCFDFINVHWK